MIGIEFYFLGNCNFFWWILGVFGMVFNIDLVGIMLLIFLVYILGIKGFFIEIRGGVVLIMVFLMIFMGKWNCCV